MEGIRRALVLGLVLIAGTAIEHAPSVGLQGCSPVSLQLLSGGIWPCMRCPCQFLFWMGTLLGNCHMCGIMLVLRAVFNMLVRNASPRGHMCFRCLMFNLSGPCEFLFLLCFIASWT